MSLALMSVAPVGVKAATIDIVWPTEGKEDTTTHVFRGSIQGTDTDDYNLFWTVGGSYAKFSSHDSYKEVQINFNSWTWKGDGPYVISFIAQDTSGKEIGRTTLSVVRKIVSGKEVMVLGTQAPAPSTPTPEPSTPSSSTLFVNPSSEAAKAAASFSGSEADKKRLAYIAGQPTGIWLGGWYSDIEATVRSFVTKAESQGQTPVFVPYNIPNRDCGQYSKGGVGDATAYKAWIAKIAAGIGTKNAIIVLEPDALAQFGCLSATDATKRATMLAEAVTTLKKNSGTKVYLDAGHAKWMSVDTAATRLSQAGIGKADGFSLNVSNFIDTTTSVAYAKKLSDKLGGKDAVLDTSRNGNGPTSSGEWCNPSGRALGQAPTLSTGHSGIDAFLWIKAPGESDGSCNGGPAAGKFWTAYAIELAKNAGK